MGPKNENAMHKRNTYTLDLTLDIRHTGNYPHRKSCCPENIPKNKMTAAFAKKNWLV